MAKGNKDYFGFSWIFSLILAIIPVTAWVFGFVTRFKEGKLVAGIIRVCFGYVIWVIDLVCMIFAHRIARILNI